MIDSDAQQIASDLAAGKGTVLSLVTKMLIDLLPLTGDNGYPSFALYSFRWWSDCQISLDAMPRQVRLSVIQSYGMTETCSQVVALPPDKKPRKNWFCWITISPSQFADSVAVFERICYRKEGKTGGNPVAGPAIVTCYLNDRGLGSGRRMAGFATGDLGYLDSEGVFVCGTLV